MPCPGSGPCKPWDLDLSCCLSPSGTLPDPCLLDGQVVDQATIDSAILTASQFLWAATGRQFGCCQVRIRPTQNPRDCPCNDGLDFGYPWTPMKLPSGEWTNISCLCGQDPCGCPAKPCQIELPYPVCSIDEVKVDGQIIGKSLYRVDDFRKLVFTPGVKNFHQELAGATGPIGGPISIGDVTVTGGTTQAYSDGIAFPDGVGGSYHIDLTTPRQDLVLEFEVQPGSTGSMVLPIAGGQFDVQMGTGHAFDPGPTKSGPVVTWTAPSDAGSTYTFFVIVKDSGQTKDIFPTITSGLAGIVSAPILKNISWTVIGSEMDCFPKCNNLSLTDDKEGTFSVLLTYGRPVPEMVRRAASEFACQLIKHCVGAPCQLPQRLTSISRQGVTASFLDPMEFLKLGMTGIYMVDLAIKTYNPHGLMQRAQVYSPDSIGKWSVTTWENKPNGREDPFGPNCT